MFDPVTLVVALAIAHIAGTAALVAVWAVNPQVPGIVAWIVGRVMIGTRLFCTTCATAVVGSGKTPVKPVRTALVDAAYRRRAS